MSLSRREFLASTGGLLAAAPLRQEPPRPERWIKSPRNPMFGLGGPQDFDRHNILSPAVAKDGGRYFLFYSGGPLGPRNRGDYVRHQLGLALSDDGEKWTKTGKPLLPLGERDDFHVTPALLRTPQGDLLKKDGVWHLVYSSNRADDVDHATSRDGLTWTKDEKSPIYKGAYAPNLLEVEGELWMYSIHKPTGADPSWQIHLARGRDFYSLKPSPVNPVLRVSQDWEVNHLVYPYVLREDRTWVMFYAAYWKNPHGIRQATAIGMATSEDGEKWTKFAGNPVLTPTPGSAYDSIYTSSQAVLRDGDHYKMYYAGRIDLVHKYFSIALATKKGRLL